MIAFLFPGQGIDPPWIAPELLAAPELRALVAIASDATSHDIGRALERGGRELARTEIAQPALVAVCLGVVRRLTRTGLAPDLALGHSLGELTAWSAAGGISDEDAVRLAAARGALMAREATRRPGGMLRVTCDREALERALVDGAGIASQNAPDEWVVTGGWAALARLAERLPAVRLPVAGAWHSPAMAGAVREFAAAIAAAPRRPLRARLIANRDGRFVDAADVPERLAGQLVQPIDWIAAMATLAAAAPARLLAIGPGKLMRQFVRRNLGETRRVEIIDSERAIADATRGLHEVA